MDQSVHQTCIEMLNQRGYSVVSDDTNGIVASTKLGKKIIVLFNGSAKFNIDRVHEYISIMQEMSINHTIVIYQNSITPVAKKVIEELQDVKIETFEEKTMRFNITKHRLVPKHTCLPKSKSDAFKKTYGVKIPVLLKSDPIARFYNFQRGDIIQIERHDGFVSFRIVK